MNLDRPVPTISLWTSLGMLFSLTVRQLLRGRRILVLSAVFALPAALALIARAAPRPPRPEEIELLILFGFLPLVLIPVTSLLYASGMIQDEIEEQTLTYLLIRPIPRGLLYLTRLLATVLVTVVLALFFTIVTAVCVWWGSEQFWSALRDRVLPLLVVLALATFVFTAVFGCLSLYFRRLLATGIAYLMLFEYFLSSFDFIVRKFTVTYYCHLLILNWIEPKHDTKWRINLADLATPSSLEAVVTLLLAGTALAVIGMLLFRATEFKVKTPGES